MCSGIICLSADLYFFYLFIFPFTIQTSTFLYAYADISHSCVLLSMKLFFVFMKLNTLISNDIKM